MDAGASFVIRQVIAQPGIDRDGLLTQLLSSFDDDPEALAELLDNAVSILLRQGLLHRAEPADAHR